MRDNAHERLQTVFSRSAYPPCRPYRQELKAKHHRSRLPGTVPIYPFCILPSSSNISLANNGTHISIGSRKLSGLLADPGSGFTAVHEKHLGDLAIKVAEHFLCLFPGTYSASPYRLNFKDFHPEKILGFLPHELDYTHLRMIWRRWKNKAANRVLGQAVTPFGPVWLDRFISTVCGFKGDFIPDFRLVDYLISLMSTDQSPALDGTLGNSIRLGSDLAQMGIFDTRMPLYQLVRLREFGRMGYSGFEHRYYSIFEDIPADMGGAADMQTLITALAFQYIVNKDVTHAMIPDTPGVESERRQMFFCAALNLPFCYVKTDTPNRFLVKIVSRIPNTRKSRRYPGYTRIRIQDYQQALIELLKTDGRELTDAFRMQAVLADLQGRINSPDTRSACGKLVSGILRPFNKKNPMHFAGDTFNRHAETYYRDTLCRRHMTENPRAVVSPADARMLPGSFADTSDLFIKEKFFQYDELIGQDRPRWRRAFRHGDYAVFRLTPDKYHYNHVPVSGNVMDIYEINGRYHSCNPGAVVQSVTPYSKNRRVVTIIDTDVEKGTGVGLVAMVEIVALMIGRIVQCYNPDRYDPVMPVQKGVFLKKGQPKSLFRPGSSTVVLICEKNRIQFCRDLVEKTRV